MGSSDNQPRSVARWFSVVFVWPQPAGPKEQRRSNRKPPNRSPPNAYLDFLPSPNASTREDPAPITQMVLLIGNYSLDRQQSMQRFTTMMLQGFAAAGVAAEVAAPAPLLGKVLGADNFVGKWLAYIDKFVLFPRKLRSTIAQEKPAIVHICDHSNAMYGAINGAPVVVTCHDLIAVRSALGEQLHCPVSFTGKLLQRWILRSLRRADTVVCVSSATREDAERLVSRNTASPKLEVVANGLNYPYRKLPKSEAWSRLKNV